MATIRDLTQEDLPSILKDKEKGCSHTYVERLGRIFNIEYALTYLYNNRKKKEPKTYGEQLLDLWKKDIREFAIQTLVWSPFSGYSYNVVTASGMVITLSNEDMEFAISHQIKYLQSIDPSTVEE